VGYSVTERSVSERPTAVIAATTTWAEYPSLWRELLDEIWRVARADDAIVPGRNVMLYKDDVPNVEVGVEVAQPFAAVGRVVPSTLPAGHVAATLHRGPFEEVGAAHGTVVDWCERNGLRRTGVRWEVYGHWNEDAPDPQVEVFHLLAGPPN
jgi:effector-binding domain-containing protein